MLGDAFGKLFSVIWEAIVWIGNALRGFFEWLGGLIWEAIQWLGELLKNLFQGLVDIIIGFFQVIYAVIDGALYLLYKVGVVAAQLFMLFFDLGRVLISFFVGFMRTLGSLHYTPRQSSGTGYSEMLGQIFTAAEPLQLNTVAYILLFIIWVSTAVMAIRLLSSVRVGGE